MQIALRPLLSADGLTDVPPNRHIWTGLKPEQFLSYLAREPDSSEKNGAGGYARVRVCLRQ